MRLLSDKYPLPPWVAQEDITRKVISPTERVMMLDLSEIYRPENKSAEQFRIFDEEIAKILAPTVNAFYDTTDSIMARVFKTYTDMHTYQTVDYVKGKHKQWLNFDHAEYTVMEALDILHNFIDEADPDINIANSLHGFQTAERIRKVHPDEDWFQLTGLIHDIGKVMTLHGEPQFSTVGDTFPVGCRPADSIAFRKSTFTNNPDLLDPRYNTKLGMYEEHCGLDQLMISWGHDEYLYQVLQNHPKCSLPEEGLFMIRFHSFYPWHTGGDYSFFMNQKDHDMFHWLKEFNKFDLYTKSDPLPETEELVEYYQGLVDKYIPGAIRF